MARFLVDCCIDTTVVIDSESDALLGLCNFGSDSEKSKIVTLWQNVGAVVQLCVSSKGPTLLTGDGKVYTGEIETTDNELTLNLKRILSVPSIAKIACGLRYNILIDDSGFTWGIGFNAWKQLGATRRTYLTEYERIGLETMGPAYDAWCWCHSTVIRTETGFWATGENGGGELGVGHDNVIPGFERVWDTIEFEIQKISAGNGFTLLLDTTGNTWVAGTNTHGQLGIKLTTALEFRKLQFVEPIQNVCALYNRSYLIDHNGEVWVAGSNLQGQLIMGDTNSIIKEFQKLPHLAYIGHVVYNHSSTIFVDLDGYLWQYGQNNDGHQKPTRIEGVKCRVLHNQFANTKRAIQ